VNVNSWAAVAEQLGRSLNHGSSARAVKRRLLDERAYKLEFVDVAEALVELGASYRVVGEYEKAERMLFLARSFLGGSNRVDIAGVSNMLLVNLGLVWEIGKWRMKCWLK